MEASCSNATNYKDISASAGFLTLNDRMKPLQQSYSHLLQEEIKKEKQILPLKNEEAFLRQKLIDLPFFLKNNQDLQEIYTQSFNDYYFSHLFNYFELSEVVDWIGSLNEGTDILAIAKIKPVTSLFAKIFLRGQPLNSLAKATVITEDFSIFVGKLNAFVEGYPFDYWTSEDPDSKLPTRVYLYHTKKIYKDKIVPFEIRVMTSKHFFLRKASKDNQTSNKRRIEQFSRCKKIYEENDYQINEIVQKLLKLQALLQKDVDDLNTYDKSQGCFTALKNKKFRTQTLQFEDALKENKLQVINGSLFLTGSAYTWSKERFPANKNYILRAEAVLGENIWLGIGPNIESWNNKNKSWTAMISGKSIWIRSGMFKNQIYFDNNLSFPTKDLVSIEIKFENNVIRLKVQDQEIPCHYNYPYNDFRVGIIAWDTQNETFIKELDFYEMK